MIQRAERPMFVASTGVFYDKAWDALRVAERNDIAVTESAPMRGHFLMPCQLARVWMRCSADLVILVGQYCMPSIGEFALDQTQNGSN